MSKKKILVFFVSLLFVLMFAASMVLIYYLIENNILPSKYRNIIFLIIGLLNLFILILIISKKHKTSLILILLFLIIFIFADYYIIRGVKALDKIGDNAMYTKTDICIAVLKDSKYKTVNDVIGLTADAPLELDKENIEKYIKNLKEKRNIEIKLNNVSSYQKAGANLIAKNTEMIILNKANLLDISNVIKDFDNKIRILDTYQATQKVIIKKSDVNVKKESFSVYLSGIDTYGSIQRTSRSDVNIIMTVNPATKKILLTSVPRDSYVRITGRGNNQYDKLTHAGIYGVNTSLKTLEKLLDTKIDYFARINFTSFIKMVDTIGGIQVDNPRPFRYSHDNHHFFAKGLITLNGKSALQFSRERYNLPGGDNDRGKNQQRVIKAILKKVMSPKILSNYNQILNDISDSMQTSMSTQEIFSLINMQLESGADWDIQMQVLKGTGDSAPSYAAGGQRLYVTRISKSSLEKNKNNIKKLLSGENNDLEKEEEQKQNN